MSSIVYGNEGVPSNDEITNSSGAIIQHPYLNSNANVPYPAAAVTAAAVSSSSTVGQYQHYYGHALPPQQLLHAQQTAGFYPPISALNHHQHHADFSTSSPSVASSSSSIESSRKTAHRKRNAPGSEKMPGTTVPTKTSAKRKMVCVIIHKYIRRCYQYKLLASEIVYRRIRHVSFSDRKYICKLNSSTNEFVLDPRTLVNY
jgi:hypothetical protein